MTESTEIDSTILLSGFGSLNFLITCYTFCFFSETLTTNSFKIGADAYNLVWNQMTMQQQKAIKLVIARSQKEFRLTGLGLIDCSLARFLAVKSIPVIQISVNT